MAVEMRIGKVCFDVVEGESERHQESCWLG
jgi:hypothetical protein